MTKLSDNDIFAALQARMGLKVDAPLDATAIKTAFWTEMRQALATNKASIGLKHLDALAEALIDGNSVSKLPGVVVLLPDPDDQETAQAPAHARFQSNSVTSKSTDTSAKSRKSSSKRSSMTQADTRKTKRAKTTSSTPNTSPGRLSTALSGTLIDPAAPKRVLSDLAKIYREAQKQGKEPFRLAYPWAGNRLWYNPVKFPAVHVAHYRFWMVYRKAFWESAINAPLRSEAAYAARRKAKMNATRARLGFLSFCIETWGYYEFLKLFENGRAHHNVLWMGGQPGKQASKSKAVKGDQGPVVDDLALIYRRDQGHYDQIIAGALDPDRIDANGYTSVPRLLELTKAIGPETRPVDNRLSDRALARIRQDITSDATAEPQWCPEPLTGLWLELEGHKRIKDLQANIERDLADNEYKLPTAPDYDSRLDKDTDFSDFEGENGFTALRPGNSDDEYFNDDGPGSPARQEEHDGSESESADESDGSTKPTIPPSNPPTKKPNSSKSSKRVAFSAKK